MIRWLEWRYRTTVLGLVMTVYFGARAGQVALSTLGPDIVASLGITMSVFGLAFTGLSLASALLQLPSGILSDRYGERVLIICAVSLTGASTLLLALAPTYYVFLPVMVVVGIGSGLYYSPSTALLDELYDQLGRAIGTYRVSGQVAGVVAPLLVGIVGTRYGWRVALFVTGLLLVPVLGGLLVFMRPTEPNDARTSLRVQAAPRRLLRLLSRSGLVGTTVLAGLVQFVEVASFTFLPAILQQHHGRSTALAGSLFALYFATVAVFNPVSGWLSDHLGRDTVTATLLLSGIVGFGLLTRQPSGTVLTAAVILAGISMTWATPVQSRFLDHLGETERGVGFGLVRTVYLLVGALGGYVTGALVTERGWSFAFGFLVVVLVACLVGLTTSRLARGLARQSGT